jgi:Kef-type K+ transport system membrane component KefB
MNFITLMQLPFQEPVLIIALILFIIFLAPVIFENLKIPSIVGLLVCGAVVGPHGLNLISPELEFTILGTIGLQYLMFLAGFEIDIIEFIENKTKSIVFGLLSFIVPFIIGFFVSVYFLNQSISSALLIAAMLSSHTLISYPILGKLGIVNKPVVTIIIGGTIIADVLALISMELIKDVSSGNSDIKHWFTIGLCFLAFFLFVFLILPRLIKLFFKYYEGETNIQYIFVLTLLFLTTVIAHLLSIEPIIGAFFFGIILNKFILKTSLLYKRIEFIGNTLFIPIFLISVGVLANFGVYIKTPGLLLGLLVLIVTAVFSKLLPAFFSKLIFRFNRTEHNMLVGLSVSRAASAIAIVLVGYNLGIIDDVIINHTVVLILVTCIISSYVTQSAGKQLAFEESEKQLSKKVSDRILVPVANPSNIANLLEFSSTIKDAENNTPIYPLTVVTGKIQSGQKVQESYDMVYNIVNKMETESKYEIITRLDNSVTNGILKAIKELLISYIIIGWHKRNMALDVIFGSVLKNLLKKTNKMVFVAKTPFNFTKTKNIHLFMPEYSEYEKGFSLWVDKVNTIGKRLKSKIFVYSLPYTIDSLLEVAEKSNLKNYSSFIRLNGFDPDTLALQYSPNDLFIFVVARNNTISFDSNYERFVSVMSRKINSNSLIYVYPEQG